MADYETRMTTTRPFAVCDPAAFEKEMISLGISKDAEAGGLAFRREEDGRYWMGGFNADMIPHTTMDGDEVYLIPMIQKHMNLDEIAVFVQNGNEGLSELTGYVIAVTKHACVSGDLDRMDLRLQRAAARKERAEIARLFGDAKTMPFSSGVKSASNGEPRKGKEEHK